MAKGKDHLSRPKITITRQTISGSLEYTLIQAIKQHYGVKFNEKAFLSLVDVYKPLYLAITGGDEQAVQDAIEESRREMNDRYKYALNQVAPDKPINPDIGSFPTQQRVEPDPPQVNLSSMEWPEVEEPEMEF